MHKKLIGNKNPLTLAEKYQTPLYIYDGNKIEEKYIHFKKAFKDIKHLKINYACKALTNQSILKFMKKIGCDIDAVSIEEVLLCLKAGFLPEQIIFTPNGISFDEFCEAVNLKVKINIDNLSILEQFGQTFPNYPVCIRINPNIFGGGHHNISTGHIDSKFGISIHQLPHVKRIIKNTGLKIEGIHMHTGSDILDIDVFLKGTKLLLDIAKDFKDLSYIDLGSGFKVAYKEGDYTTDINILGKLLSKQFNEFCKEYNKDLTLIFEPGKFLVSEAGYFLVKANVVKQTTSTVFVSVNSGFNHFIRPMFYNAHHDILNISAINKNITRSMRYYSVVGYICEADTFAHDRKILEIKEGDILCFKNAGAYCFSMSSNYNSRLKPAEVLIYKEKEYLIRKKETIDDLLNNQVVVDFE